MIVSTTRCKAHGHAEFVLEIDDNAVPQQHVTQIIQTLEGMVAQGSVFKPGESFQIGWMTTKVQQYDKERLTLYEPDMRTFPMAFVPGVTATLRQMMLQLFFIDSLALPRDGIKLPSVRQAATVCKNYHSAKRILVSRDKPQAKADSGWSIVCHHEDHNHDAAETVAIVSLYEAFLNRNEIQGWMAFPEGTLIALQNGEPPRVFKDGAELRILHDSFLSRLLEQKSQ